MQQRHEARGSYQVPSCQSYRVFGIGLPRTGTLSLSIALNSIGIPTVHGAYEMFPGALDLSHTIYHEYRGFVDTPFYLLFDELNARYPDSKFILTTRSLDRWLDSCATLWEYKTAAFPQNHPVWLYAAMTFGTHSYNSRRFGEVYHQHREFVDRFFASVDKSRCLTLDLDAGYDLWHVLATFLQVSQPTGQYPHTHSSDQLRRGLRKLQPVSAPDATLVSTPCSMLVRQFEHWTVSHSSDLQILGYLIVSSRNQNSTLSNLPDGPRSELAHVLAWVYSAVKRLTVSQKVYILALEEDSSVLQLHIVPRPKFIHDKGASFLLNLRDNLYKTRSSSVIQLLHELSSLPGQTPPKRGTRNDFWTIS